MIKVNLTMKINDYLDIYSVPNISVFYSPIFVDLLRSPINALPKNSSDCSMNFLHGKRNVIKKKTIPFSFKCA